MLAAHTITGQRLHTSARLHHEQDASLTQLISATCSQVFKQSYLPKTLQHDKSADLKSDAQQLIIATPHCAELKREEEEKKKNERHRACLTKE